jgi:adenylosuccinate lyase
MILAVRANETELARPVCFEPMDLTTLTAISPIDGRYWNQSVSLAAYFSEFSLIRYRVLVEVEYFLALCDVVPDLKDFKADENNVTTLRKIYSAEYFNVARAQRVKDIEKTTNHDVKAVEYFLKDYFDENGWQKYREWIHFALTSQDINNTAIPLSLKVCDPLRVLNFHPGS